MSNSTMRVLAMACSFAVVALVMPATGMAGVFGCSSCVAPVAVAPACSTCVPPTVTYRAYYRPAVVTAYQPVVGCNTCTGYAVTAYRPWYGGWTTYSARMVPYTVSRSYYEAYQPVYAAAPVVTYVASPCVSCSPSVGCNAFGSGCCGTTTYTTPTSSCSSCVAAPATVAPPPVTNSSQTAPSLNASPPKTFQEKVEKPATEPELKPIPRTDTQLNSTPAPALPDPRGRTATRSDSASARVVLTAAAASASPAQSDDGWRPARD